MTTAAKNAFQPDTDVHITYEDQLKINVFARLNAQFEDFKEELKNKQNDVRNLDDAVDELELMDDGEQIPYLIGEVFIFQDTENTQKSLAEQKQKLLKDIENINKKSADIKETMTSLKTELYGKFGSHINLEPEED